MNRPKAILFDLDDTLIDHSGSLERGWEVMLDRAVKLYPSFNRGLFPAARDKAAAERWSDPDRHREGRLDLRKARREVMAGALKLMGYTGEHADELGDIYHDWRERSYELFPGAMETLESLRAEGIKLGLVTNGEAYLQRSKLERFDLARHFDHIQIEEEFGLGKPDEEAYRHALDALAVQPEEAWMVGDNLEWEVVAPQRLGIYGVWVDFAGKGLPEDSRVEPDLVVRSVNELLEALGIATSTDRRLTAG